MGSTRAALMSWVERVAVGLHDLGICQGATVTWGLPTPIEAIVISFALSRIGAVQNPIVHIYRHPEVGSCIHQTGAEFVIVPGERSEFDYRSMVEEVTADLESPPTVLFGYDDLPEGDAAILPPSPVAPGSADDAPIRWLYHTSGTASDTKGVKHTDRALISAGVGLAKALDTGSDDVGSIASPCSHMGGPGHIVMMLVSGFPAILIERFTPAAAVVILAGHGATIVGGSTALYQMYLAGDQLVDGPAIPSLRVMAGGGVPKPPQICHEVLEKRTLISNWPTPMVLRWRVVRRRS